MTLYDFLISRLTYDGYTVEHAENINALIVNGMQFGEHLLLEWYKVKNNFNTVYKFIKMEAGCSSKWH